MATATKRVSLRWSGEGTRFEGGPDGALPAVIDGDSRAGPSPMDALLLGLAGCMAADVVLILEKSRVPLESLVIDVEGDRAENPPRRYERIRLTYRVTGPSEEDAPKLQRAVDLSRETYCSVLHTLRPDLDLDVTIERG